MRTRKKVLVGTVVSDKMDKTIVVRVERIMMHPRYKKYIKRHKKYYVHDPLNEAREDDVVKIIESRPLSRLKRWRLLEIVKRGGVKVEVEDVPEELKKLEGEVKEPESEGQKVDEGSEAAEGAGQDESSGEEEG